MTPLDIKPDFTEEPFRAMLQPLLNGHVPSLTFETVHKHKDGHTIPVEVFLQVVRQEDQKLICVALVRDITERKQTEEEIHRLSYYDPITQLPNRRLMCEAEILKVPLIVIQHLPHPPPSLPLEGPFKGGGTEYLPLQGEG